MPEPRSPINPGRRRFKNQSQSANHFHSRLSSSPSLSSVALKSVFFVALLSCLVPFFCPSPERASCHRCFRAAHATSWRYFSCLLTGTILANNFLIEPSFQTQDYPLVRYVFCETPSLYLSNASRQLHSALVEIKCGAQRLLPSLPSLSLMSHAKQSAAEEGGSDDRAKSGAIPPRRGDSRVQFGIQLGTVSRPPSLLHSKRSSRNDCSHRSLSWKIATWGGRAHCAPWRRVMLRICNR